MFVRTLIATGPRCFKCRYVMPLRPEAKMGLVCSIADLFMSGEKGVGSVLGRCLRCSLLSPMSAERYGSVKKVA